ncbi:oxygenase MpaB family protein [Streptomyces prasinus]|uniref:oxygenase MpaB family protein n=1 Tax=Streptomyces prasinus TaxID=67345 RepID=UPI0033FF846B
MSGTPHTSDTPTPLRPKGTDATSRIRAPRGGGAARRCFGDVRSTPAAPRPLLPQVSHPVAGAGVADHGNFRAEPRPRPIRTLLSLTTVVHGGREAATAEARRLVRVHTPVKGTDPATRRSLGAW